MTTIMSRWTLSLVMLLGFVAGSFKAPPAAAQAVNPVQSQETNTAGIIAELIECKREDGVLTIRLRFRNTTDKKVRLDLIGGFGPKYNDYYVTAGNKKYFILHDSEKKALATQPNVGINVVVHLDKGDAYVWWAKYPAPPAEVRKVSYYTPLASPFDNVPIKD